MRAARRLVLFLLLPLGGCATGDFGRVKPPLAYDDIHAWVGWQAARDFGYRPFSFELTDDERLLRDLAYPLIEPPYDRGRWDSLLFEYGIAPTRGPVWPRVDQAAYGRRLLNRSFWSPTGRYSQLIDDIRDDSVRVASFVDVARRVLDMDNKRSRSLAYVSRVSAQERSNARQRVNENSLVVNWVYHSLRERAAGYRRALERVVVETPSPMAADAERVLNLLRQQIAAAKLG